MAQKLTAVASDTLRLMLMVYEVLGDSVVGMSKAVPVPTGAAARSAPARPATAPAASRSKKKGKKKAAQAEPLGAAQRAALAESQRLERIKTLQRRFVELHVAEKRHQRKNHLLRLYIEHEARKAAPQSAALLTVEEKAEMDVMGGKRELMMAAEGGDNVLLMPGGAGDSASKADLEQVDAARLSKLMEIMAATDSLITHTAAHTDAGAPRVLPASGDIGTVGAGSACGAKGVHDKLSLHSDTKERIKTMCAEMRGGGGVEAVPHGIGGGSEKKQKPSTSFKRTLAAQQWV